MTQREWVGFNRSQVESILSCLEDLCLAKHKKARPPDAPTSVRRAPHAHQRTITQPRLDGPFFSVIGHCIIYKWHILNYNCKLVVKFWKVGLLVLLNHW